MNHLSNFYGLPFYLNHEKRHRLKWYVHECFFYPTPEGCIPPFQFDKTEGIGDSFVSFKLKNLQTDGIYDMTSQMNDVLQGNLQIVSETNYDKVIYNWTYKFDNDKSPGNPFPLGQYEAYLEIGANTYVSEPFYMLDDVSKYLKVKWWHDENMTIPGVDGRYIKYDTGFQNVMYFPSELAKPKYPFEEEVARREGKDFPRTSIMSKEYGFDFLAPEWLMDCINLAQGAHHVEVTWRGDTYAADRFLLTPEWVDKGDLMNINAELRVDSVVVVTGKGVL